MAAPKSFPFSPGEQPGAYHIELHSTKDGADKLYDISIIPQDGGQFTVDTAWGRRGKPLKTQTETPEPVGYAVAREIANNVLAEKVNGKSKYNPITSLSGHLLPAAVEGQPLAAPALLSGTGEAPPAFVRSEETGMSPQLLTAIDSSRIDALLRDPRWVVEQKYDGDRCTMVVARKPEGGFDIYGSNRLSLRVALPPATIASMEYHEPFVLDGELMGGGRFFAFDLLEQGDGGPGSPADLRPFPFKARFEARNRMITALARPDSKVEAVFTAQAESEKRALLRKVTRLNAEGVVFKQGSAPYEAGRSETQLKYKLWESLSALVMGPAANGKRSVKMGLRDEDGRVLDVGHVKIPDGVTVKTGSIIEVRYIYATPVRANSEDKGRLNQPVFLKVRTDVAPEECLGSQRKFKGDIISIGDCPDEVGEIGGPSGVRVDALETVAQVAARSAPPPPPRRRMH